MATLEQILEREQKNRHEGGDFGIAACKESILDHVETNKAMNRRAGANVYTTSLYVLLEGYVKRANEDVFFNRAMVLACWELINER